MTLVLNENARMGDAFIVVLPNRAHSGIREQFDSLAIQTQAALHDLRMDAGNVVRGWVRFAEMPSWNWRDSLTTAFNGVRTPITGVLQPPADGSLKCTLELHLLRDVKIPPASAFAYGGGQHLQLMSIGPRSKIRSDADFESLTYDMFEQAGRELAEHGFAFADVVRTWVHVSDIDRNYAAMNRARNRYFREQGLKWPPASTCVESVPVGVASPVALDLYALSAKPDTPLKMNVVQSSAMGEATAYGVAFSRAIRIRQRNVERLFVSGTASIDDRGQVVSVGDVQGQLDCMFRNVASVLSQARMDLANIRSATMYLKEAGFLRDAIRAARAHGLPETVPCAVVVAKICRPEWLCEIEVYASRESE